MMKETRITRLAAALGVAVAGAAATDAALAVGDSMGQIVTFPYYTVQGGMSTFFNVTNTTTAALAVKVRFHEAVNSRDVLDFNILMSPKDAWTGYILPNANGGVTLMTDDNSCTSPLIPATGLTTAKLAYTGVNADSGPDGADRSKEGYVELMVMGECDGQSTDSSGCFSATADGPQGILGPGIGYLTEHVDGKPRDCETADAYFAPRNVTGVGGVPWDETSIPTNGNPIAAGSRALTPQGSSATPQPDPRGYNGIYQPRPLKGNLTLLDISNGIAGGNAALHHSYIIPPGSNMVTAQNFPYFLEPTVSTAPSGHIWDTSDIYGFEFFVGATNVVNEWSSNPDNGVATDWIVNFPTKAYHVDQFCNVMQANNNRWRYAGAVAGGSPLPCVTSTSDPNTDLVAGVDYSPSLGSGNADGTRVAGYYPTVAPFEERFADGKSDITASYSLYDRSEGGKAASGTAPSPAPPAELPSLPHETNVVAFTSVDDPNVATESPNAQPIDASAILNGALYGWANLSFPQAPAAVYDDVGQLGQGYLPVTGFLVKTRTFGTPDSHYGQIQDHGYQPFQYLYPWYNY